MSFLPFFSPHCKTLNLVVIPASRCSAMWQCITHSPGFENSARISTVFPAGTNTVSFHAKFSFLLTLFFIQTLYVVVIQRIQVQACPLAVAACAIWSTATCIWDFHSNHFSIWHCHILP